MLARDTLLASMGRSYRHARFPRVLRESGRAIALGLVVSWGAGYPQGGYTRPLKTLQPQWVLPRGDAQQFAISGKLPPLPCISGTVSMLLWRENPRP